MKIRVAFILTCLLGILILLNPSAHAETFNMGQYRLGSGDVIKVTVYGQGDLSLETRLPDTGIINYPFLGDIKAVGMTAAQLENAIYLGLKGDYLVNPSISVSIVEYRPFFIDGEIKKPGGYPYQPGLSVDKAAAVAGGYTQRAAKDNIKILREINGVQKELSPVKTSDTVLPGDIVRVQQSFF
ncbi:polysaccharide biosynthesis/export family protein [Neptunicella sp. SCSIO 80796]|uniref:polysaccharide biosynthesis/export family protein n=1 Tax=Neptunicella plasticusilytica TaxID=3117012 RepID=UPI003A4D34E8